MRDLLWGRSASQNIFHWMPKLCAIKSQGNLFIRKSETAAGDEKFFNLRSEKIAPGFCTPDFGDFRISHARRQHGSKNHSKKTASGLEGVSKTLGGLPPPRFLTLPQALMLSSSNGFLIHAVFLRCYLLRLQITIFTSLDPNSGGRSISTLYFQPFPLKTTFHKATELTHSFTKTWLFFSVSGIVWKIQTP